MPTQSIPRRYAEALFHLAEETGDTEAIRADMESIAELLRRTPVLHSLLESPDVSDKEKNAFFESIVKERVKDSTWLFLQLLLRRKRTALIPDILSEYERMEEEKRGIKRVRVVSAVPLKEDEKDLLVTRLHSLTGKTVLMETAVDKSILGGVVVYVDGKIIDGSIRTELEELRNRLLAKVMD